MERCNKGVRDREIASHGKRDRQQIGTGEQIDIDRCILMSTVFS